MTLSLNVPDVSPRQRLQPQNALLVSVPAARAPGNLPPAVQSQRLRSAIGHAAVLSDTPEKWAATVDLLRDRSRWLYDFEMGRPLAIAASAFCRSLVQPRMRQRALKAAS